MTSRGIHQNVSSRVGPPGPADGRFQTSRARQACGPMGSQRSCDVTGISTGIVKDSAVSEQSEQPRFESEADANVRMASLEYTQRKHKFSKYMNPKHGLKRLERAKTWVLTPIPKSQGIEMGNAGSECETKHDPLLSFQDEKAKKPTKKPQPRLQAYAEADVVVPLS